MAAAATEVRGRSPHLLDRAFSAQPVFAGKARALSAKRATEIVNPQKSFVGVCVGAAGGERIDSVVVGADFEKYTGVCGEGVTEVAAFNQPVSARCSGRREAGFKPAAIGLNSCMDVKGLLVGIAHRRGFSLAVRFSRAA